MARDLSVLADAAFARTQACLEAAMLARVEPYEGTTLHADMIAEVACCTPRSGR